MEMIRWLLNNKLVQTVWGLGILAVLLAWIFGGNNAEPEVAVAAPVKVEQVVETEATDTSVKVVEAEITAEIAAEKASAEVAETEIVAEVKANTEPATTEVQAAVGVVAATVAVVATQTEVEAAEEKVAESATKEAVTESVVDLTKDVVTQTAEAEPAESKDIAESSEETVIETKAESVAETTDAEPVEADTTEVGNTDVVQEEVAAVISDSLDSKSSEDLLMMARESYWNNGLDEATDLYTALIEREPNVIEHKGELGNVFWRQGYPKKAAELYADIAAPMIEKGNGERVSNMVGFIGLFFPDRASEIRKLLEAQ